MRSRQMISVLLAAVIALSSVGCSGAPSSGTGSSGSGSPSGTEAGQTEQGGQAGQDGEKAGNGKTDTKERTITWMTVRSSWPAMNMIAEDYMKENPDVKVEFEVISDRSTYNQKLKILAASNELPDLFDSEGDTLLSEIASTGALVDVDGLYKDLGYDRMMNIGENYARLSDGKLYSLAWENNIEYFWYHKDLFKKAGIQKTPETFDELLDTCQQLKDAGITPISTWPGWALLRWMAFIPYRLEGNDYIEKLKVGEAKMGDPVGIQAANFFQKLGTEYFQPGWSTSDYTSALENFISGNAAIYYIGTWQFSSFMDENRELKDDYAYFYMPSMEGAVNGRTDMWANAGTGTSISKDKYDDQLKDFIKYVLDSYPETAFYKTSVMPPMDFDTTLGTFSDFDQKVMDDCNNLTDYGYSWDVRMDSATVEVMNKEIVNLGMGAITPEEFAQRIDAAIAENAPKFFR